MATLYNRLELYCKTNKAKMPPPEIRQKLGTIVLSSWFSEENNLRKHIPIHRQTFIDESGKPVKVLSYPKKFLPVIDKIILKHYFENNTINNIVLKDSIYSDAHSKKTSIEKKERKRIPVNKKPIYSSSKKY
jgi:hypothetical protein